MKTATEIEWETGTNSAGMWESITAVADRGGDIDDMARIYAPILRALLEMRKELYERDRAEEEHKEHLLRWAKRFGAEDSEIEAGWQREWRAAWERLATASPEPGAAHE